MSRARPKGFERSHKEAVIATFTGVPLHNAFKLGEDRVAQGWIETIIAGTPAWTLSGVLSINGRQYVQEHEYVQPDVQFRDLNEDYTDTYGDTVESVWGTTIIGGQIKIDVAALRSGMSDPAKLISRRYAEHAKSAAQRVNYEWINGTGASSGFKGLKQLVTDGWGTAVNAGGSGSGNLDFDNLDDALLNIEHGPVSMFLTNKYLEVEFSKKARAFSSFPLLDVGTDALGRPVKRYNGVPIMSLRTGRTSAGAVADVISQAETDGGGSAEGSIYALRFSEDAVTTLLGNNASMSMKSLAESTEGPYVTGRLEFYPGLASFDKHSVVRYAGITRS